MTNPLYTTITHDGTWRIHGVMEAHPDDYFTISPAHGEAIFHQLTEATSLRHQLAETETAFRQGIELVKEGMDHIRRLMAERDDLALQIDQDNEGHRRELQRVEEERDGARADLKSVTRIASDAQVECVRLRAELAARPDLTELRQAYQEHIDTGCGESDVYDAVARVFSADPAPAEHVCTYDPVTGDGCGDPIHDSDTVTVTFRREDAEHRLRGYGVPSASINRMRDALRSALDGTDD